MKTLLMIALGLLPLLSFAQNPQVIECERKYDSSKLHYHFEFTAAKVVTATITLDQQQVSPPARVVLYSQGSMVGMFNEISHDEELFLITKDLLQANVKIEKKVEVLYRDGSVVKASCWNSL